MYCINRKIELVQKYNYYAQDAKGNYLCPQGNLFEYAKDAESSKYGIYPVKQCFVYHACKGCPVNESRTKGKDEKALVLISL